jgi:hypothetical protein
LLETIRMAPNPSLANASVALSQALSRKQLVVICGTGVAAAATGGADGSSWVGLIKDGIYRVHALGLRDDAWVARALGDVDTNNTGEMIVAAEKVTLALQEMPASYSQWLSDSAGSLQVQDHALLAAIARLQRDGAVIATTNYDSLISDELNLPVVTSADSISTIQGQVRGIVPGVLHIHGHWQYPDTVVFGSSTYARVVDSAMTKLLLQTFAWSQTILFAGVGEGLADPNFQQLRKWANSVIGSTAYPHYRLARSDSFAPIAAEHHDENIAVVDYGPEHGDLPAFLNSIAVSAPIRAALEGSARVAGRAIRNPETLSAANRSERERLVNDLRMARDQLLEIQAAYAQSEVEYDYESVLDEPLQILVAVDLETIGIEELKELLGLSARVRALLSLIES